MGLKLKWYKHPIHNRKIVSSMLTSPTNKLILGRVLLLQYLSLILTTIGANVEIKLEKPYSSLWSKGYVVINPEGRETLILYNSHKDRSSTQYARYLLSVSLGRFLEKEEHVDHIDGEKTNNSLSNLQILSLEENNRKTHKKPNVTLNCPVCKVVFKRTRTQLRGRLHKVENHEICCSRGCGSRKKYMEIL